jgi:hypothetical protein
MSQQFTSLFDVIDQLQAEAHSSRLGVIFKSAGTGEELRDEGMAKAMAKAASQAYKLKMEEALRSYRIGDVLTADDLRRIAGPPPAEISHNTAGAIFAGMAKRGLIEKTNLKPAKSQRPIAHCNELPYWRLVRYADRIAA